MAFFVVGMQPWRLHKERFVTEFIDSVTLEMAQSESELLEYLEDVNAYWQLQQEIGQCLSDGFFQLTLARKSKDAANSMRSNPDDMRFELDPIAYVTISPPSSSSLFSSAELALERQKKVPDPMYIVSGNKKLNFHPYWYIVTTL